MTGRWFRFYDEALDDPKVQRLPPPLFKIWVNLLCLASRHGGKLPDDTTIAFALRVPEAKAATHVQALAAAGLIDIEGDNIEPHNWGGRQHQSDTSNDRVKRFRERHRNVTSTVTVAAPDTETEENRKDVTADAVTPSAGKYFFESGVIRLNETDFKKWQEAFSHLDLKAELIGLSAWASDQGPRWFHAVSGALAKRNREIHKNGARKSDFWDPNAGIM